MGAVRGTLGAIDRFGPWIFGVSCGGGTAVTLWGVRREETADRHGVVIGSPGTRTAARRSLLWEETGTTSGWLP